MLYEVHGASHSGYSLHAPPVASVGLNLTEEKIRISVAQSLGVWTCSPHTYICGKLVHARGLHSLSCRKCTPIHLFIFIYLFRKPHKTI